MSQSVTVRTDGLSETELAECIGEEYINGDFESEGSDRVRDAYRKIAEVNERLFEEIPVPVEFTEDDPYESFEDMKQSVPRSGVFRVFSGGTHPEFMTREENIKGRAVHDWFGHLGEDVDFSFAGEFKKWDSQKMHYPVECWPVLFAEVVGQVSAAYYLEEGFDSERFAQRPILAPSRWMYAARRVVE